MEEDYRHATVDVVPIPYYYTNCEGSVCRIERNTTYRLVVHQAKEVRTERNRLTDKRTRE